MITLKDEHATKLRMYLLMSSNYRNGEEAACRELSLETNKDGKPEFPNMAGNAKWWQETNAIIEEIIAALS